MDHWVKGSPLVELTRLRGFRDLFGADARAMSLVEDRARALALRYNFSEIRIPLLERIQLFARSTGETSDIVEKQMYAFTDRDEGETVVALRPEGTPSVVRAYVEAGLDRSDPEQRFFYSGPVFRRERPQKGRFRQFHQIGVELIGVAQPLADIEVIALGSRILDALGVAERVELELNTLGNSESRAAYREALVAYFSARVTELSEDSRRRLERNPLRILDSKEETDQIIVRDAPPFEDYLNSASRHFFDQVRAGLDRLGIAYRQNARLVRGLDYYTHTAFEFVTSDLGAQGTVMGGGRYDGLVELMGGPALPGVGWAAGIERLAMLITEPPAPRRPVAVVPIGEAAEEAALTLAEVLRNNGCPVDLGYSGNVARRMRRANHVNARVAVLIGDDEIVRNVVALRDLDSGEQSEVAMDLSLSELRARLRAFYP